MRAEGLVTRGLGGFQADGSLEPLTILIHQTDQGDGCAGDLGCQLDDSVEDLLRLGVDDVGLVEFGQTFGFIGR